MTAPPKIMLASSSQTRKDMLTRAGLAFEAAAPDVDERQVQQSIAALSFGDQATALALAKARNVAQRYKDALVIGSDQSLEVDGEVLHKVSSASAAKSQLQRLMGRPHRLHTAVSVVNNGNEIFRHVEVPVLHMRNLPEKELDAYVESGGSTILASVGCYQLEGRGIQLFEKIDGDYFAILGLPLLPLLSFLRRAGVMPS